jgi:hypothetical protein
MLNGVFKNKGYYLFSAYYTLPVQEINAYYSFLGLFLLASITNFLVFFYSFNLFPTDFRC